MTNLEKWYTYTKYLESPQTYIDFGFYWLICACLQRRVWYFDDEGNLFPNLYVCFVGPPSTGKGLVLSRAKELLLHHRNENAPKVITNIGKEHPPLFPVGGDTITFESLLANMSDNIVMTPVHKDISPTGIYSHTSYAFCLTELSSLFKKHKDDVIKFLIKAFDCEDYDNLTKNVGNNRIRRMCLNFAAGTQMDFIKDSYKTGLFGQGFASRVLWLFEYKTRFDEFFVGTQDDETREAKRDLLAWVKRLAGVLGSLSLDEEVKDWLRDWYKTKLVPARDKATVKMQEYYGRKRVNLLKLAAGVHYSYSLAPIITLHDMITADKLLDNIEPNMAAGFAMSGRNELHKFTMQMLLFVKNMPRRKATIQLEFGMDMTLTEIDQCIKELELGYNLKTKTEKGELVYYI